MSSQADYNHSGNMKLDQMMLLSNQDKKGKPQNARKMMKKFGKECKLNEIQKMLQQIREERKRNKKPKVVQNEYLMLDSSVDPGDMSSRPSLTLPKERFSLNNIKNISFQNERIDHTLDQTETHEFHQKKSTASQAVGQARIFIKNQNPGFFDVPRNYLQPHHPGYIYQNSEPEDDPTNPFKGLKYSEIFADNEIHNKRQESKREENFIMNYSRSQNLKKSIINKRRNETISQRFGAQKLPDMFLTEVKETKSPLKIITEFNPSSMSRKESTNTLKTCENVNTIKLRPLPEERKREDPIENLRNKNNEINEFIKTLKDDRLRKAMEMFKLSIENEDAQGKSNGFKNTINFGYVGYLLKSDYFQKQEKKEYLNNNNQYPNKKMFFFKPQKSSRKNSLAPPENKKRASNFNDFLYEMDPCTSPNTLGRNVKEFYKGPNSLEEKKNQLIEYVKQYVRREEQEFYRSNLNFSTENISFRKTYQKDLMRSKELKKEIVEFYNNLIDYHENEAEIKQFKENLINSFKGYDDSFQKFIKELIKYNDYLRKIDNDRKTFTFDIEEYAPNP